MKKSFSFKAKLLALCVFMVAISGTVGFVSYKGVHAIEDSYEKVSGIAMPNQETLSDMFLAYRGMRLGLITLGLPGLTKEQGQEYVKRANDYMEIYIKEDKEYTSIPFQEGEGELYKKVNVAWIEFQGISQKVLELYSLGTPEAKEKLFKIYMEDFPQAAKVFTAAIEDLKKYNRDNAQFHVKNAEASVARTDQLVLLVTSVGSLIGLAIGFIFSTKVSSTLMHVAKALASNAAQVSSASTEIASSSEELSQASTEQASSLEETAASLEEITAMIAKASDSAEATATSSAESHKKAEEGRAAVDQMLNSMDEISQSNEAILTQITDSNRQMTDIVKVIQEIGNKTKVINEIVFQTKLLSFNASVEAARAGEHGKGFAVVAEEVGNLAQMSGNAAKEITEMLDGSISRVEKIVVETKLKVESLAQKGKEKVESGVAIAQQCSDVLNEIVQNVSRVSGLSLEISQANKEQSQGVSEINKAMSQLDTVTQQNAATSEEAASAAEELSAQAESLKSAVNDLVVVINGSNEVNLDIPAATAAPVKKSAPKSKSNLVHLKTNKKAGRSHTAANSEMKRASGDDSSVPSREDDGFRDV